MRKFKEIRETIKEYVDNSTAGLPRARTGPLGGPDNGVDGNANLAILHPAEIDRINTYLGAMAARSYIDPNEVLKEAWAKLGIVGINFKMNPQDDLRMEGVRQYPISLFGGSFGADGTSYGYKPEDDNIERRIGKKLFLEISSSKTMEGLTALRAKIVSVSP